MIDFKKDYVYHYHLCHDESNDYFTILGICTGQDKGYVSFDSLDGLYNFQKLPIKKYQEWKMSYFSTPLTYNNKYLTITELGHKDEFPEYFV